MANIPAALRELPLEHIIGAPMQAAIKAQAFAAQTTVDFIKEVGLKSAPAAELEQNSAVLPGGGTPEPRKTDEMPDPGADDGYEARYVEFKFDRVVEEREVLPVPPNSPTGTQPEVRTHYTVVPSRLTVPLLSIVPVPFIRIDDMSISFEYAIRDIETHQDTSTRSVSASASAKYWFIKASVKGSYTSQSVNKRETDQRATLKINVNAVQDRAPEGLIRVLQMLQENMKVVPLNPPREIA